jgi:hypothetical protein
MSEMQRYDNQAFYHSEFKEHPATDIAFGIKPVFGMDIHGISVVFGPGEYGALIGQMSVAH